MPTSNTNYSCHIKVVDIFNQLRTWDPHHAISAGTRCSPGLKSSIHFLQLITYLTLKKLAKMHW